MTTTSLTSQSEYSEKSTRLLNSLPPVSKSISTQTCEESTKNLKGKVIVITGSGAGFGASYSLRAAQAGAKVIISDLNVGALSKIVEESKKNDNKQGGEVTAYGKSCNCANWEDQVAMFKFARETYGHIDIVIPNAGIGEVPGWFEDSFDSNGELEKPNSLTIEVNVIGMAYTVKLAFYHLRQNPTKEKKAIVFIGSMASHLGIPGGPTYSIAKHAVLGLFRSTKLNAEVDGINTSIICPWFSPTGILEVLTRVALIGLPLASIEDVVSAMLYASSEPNCSGNTIVVDAEGILAVPFSVTEIGPTGYYAEFAKRAYAPIKLRRIIHDIHLIQLQYGGPKSLIILLSLVVVILGSTISLGLRVLT